MKRRDLMLLVSTFGMMGGVQAAKEVAPGATGDTHLRELLQGRWQGQEAGREALGACTLNVTGNAIQFQGAMPQDAYQASFVFVAGTQPQEMLATITDCSVSEYVGRTARFICWFENGVLMVAGSEPGSAEAPKGFEPQQGVRVFSFRKSKN